ncbi:MAG: ABC transporter permease [Eubacterium sp.]|jgi:ABC-type Na+ efflux pump, permease component|nr:ABC transporter permease [Eubacterium sp.]
MLAIYKKELHSYFTSVLGWVFIAFFLVMTGLYFVLYNLINGIINFSYVYDGIQMIFVFLLVPVLTMRSVAEENRQKTDQLLYTAPISITKIIAGKYLALITLLAAAMAIVCTYPLLFNNLIGKAASNGETVDFAVAYGSTFGFFLLGAAYIAIGLFISSMTESQVIAAVASGIIMIFTYLMSGIAGLLPADGIFHFYFLAVLILILAVVLYFWIHNGWLAAAVGLAAEGLLAAAYLFFSDRFTNLISNILEHISITDRYSNFTLGIFDGSALIYYLSVSFLFVFLTIQRIQKKRYNR